MTQHPTDHTTRDSRRNVVVTGGGTGIGRATARAFAARGDRVLIVGRSKSTLDETADHPDIHTLPLSLLDPRAPQLIVETARRTLGGIDVLVNNAARSGFREIGELDEQDIREQVGTNLLAPILLTRSALPELEAARGVVVNIGSAGALGVRAMPGSSVYAATKAGLDSLTRTWAMELGPRGIRVVGLAPGLIDTGVGVRAGMPQETYDAFLAGMRPKVPAGRIGTPEEIAWWITTLASPEAGYANGAIIAVDGGLSVT
ncbi:SDR family NAD(P)-dependent oxidoreductase [Streptomyces sp. ST2-7A]|uniref:SDR family NAD(P)-dependent oxidoreductase n=1 Tax=Streptomyces sp. ST2-7A TaxID=2907214 RepID=UPI001F47E233|nr:SDR family oxidoreductase [Streptomyces sp. ST2-7A]MCE7081119.1 SDR family oxidoreductase [Streptomyces sp. ST2-7A]